MKRRGFIVQVVDSPEEARSFVRSILPLDKTIFTSLSETVRLSGLDQDINGAGTPYKSLRRELDKMDPQTQFRERVKLGAAPDVIVGRVHAMTEEGQVLVASGSGNQLGPFAASARRKLFRILRRVCAGWRCTAIPLRTFGCTKRGIVGPFWRRS